MKNIMFETNCAQSCDTEVVNAVTDSSKKRKRSDISNKGSIKKKCKNAQFKLPTVEELNNLKETENLFNNNLFRLQIKELISEVEIKHKRKRRLSEWSRIFEMFLDTLPTYECMLDEILKGVHGVKLIHKLGEYQRIFKTDHDIPLKFCRPHSYHKFGLYENNALAGPALYTNYNLVLPKQTLHAKDFLNNRYLIKRYYYLLYIVEELKTSNLATNLEIDFHEGNHLLPIIKLEPTGCDKTIISIYVTPASECFKPQRFLPTMNNLKFDLYDTELDAKILKEQPTVYYNNLIAHDVALKINNDLIYETLNGQTNIQEGIKLLCIWLKQWDLNVSFGSFTENMILYIIVYLFQKKKINQYMSSYQVARNFWSFLGTTNLITDPVILADTTIDYATFSVHSQDAVLILDKTGCYNASNFLTKEAFGKIQVECQRALELLDKNTNNSFQQLFLTKQPFYLQYDLILDLSKSIPLKQNYRNEEIKRSMYVGYDELFKLYQVFNIVNKAVSKRVNNIVPIIEMDKNNLKKFFMGVNLNPMTAFGLIEKGPALNDLAQAEEFRKFWGHLSSDRRFRDGSTNVAVYFTTNTIHGKRKIMKTIFDYVISEKLGLEYRMLFYNHYEDILLSKRLVPSYASGANEETSLKGTHSLDELGKILRSLQIPLKITGVQGVSDTFCFTEVFPPIPSNFKEGNATSVQGNNLIFANINQKVGSLPRYVQPLQCILQLEHSSKWPNNLQALRGVRLSFFITVSKLLQNQYNILSNIMEDFMDVYYNGLVFRFRFHTPKEIALVKKFTDGDGITRFVESTESQALERWHIMPKVVSALKGVQSTYPSYGPGTALIKRWIRAQLHDESHISDIVINLINASLYINAAESPPNSIDGAFFRFAKFFSEFDWKLQPIIVNFNDDMSKEEVSTLESKFQANRGAYSPLFIIMQYDQGLSLLTQTSPSEEVLASIKRLSKQCVDCMSRVVFDPSATMSIKEMFKPNLDGFNVVIHIQPLLNTRIHEALVLSTITNRIVVEKYKTTEDDKIPIVGFDPVEKYLSTLRENYGKYAVFFHDSYGGSVIGVLWNPQVHQTLDFKPNHVNAGKLTGNKITFNVDAVIEDFWNLGGELVKTIERR
ncbi:unnamed protein product [Phaedon cochleariae]|uniref:Nucleolar protein 6 n=1 Tax=Phaedon cochleariae TaxID=80249 RepID=A0A9P0DQ22_PHACE|nr:unnamed protein product [Phaedon cochleariae]